MAKNAKVYLACRSKEKADEAIGKLKGETGKEAVFLRLDLADMESVRRTVEEFKESSAYTDLYYNGMAWDILME